VAHHSVEILSQHKCLFEFTEIDGVAGLSSQAPEAYPEGVLALDALILLYDVGSRSSFSQIAEIYQSILSVRGKLSVPTAVVANKFDMFQESRQISDDEGMELAETIGADFAKCSAREGDGVKEVVKQIMRHAIDGRLREVAARDLNKERTEKKEREQEKMMAQRARVKRTMSGRILSRLSWGSSAG